ncbi:MAG: DHA2 family efflux MFS transporter permease subunit [Deltaproteobacteria bacterium]|uniref:DHA2 family efflux MFS transporter permease subunit n=1 Tax=Candidatus Zymogenus saltonus TaxID=2844893 RepID=A0A9D8PNW8_9DELT|nr:DHA2 family efflux MFS transporter permease subunit [Candidatus Zymogenus saltonus]
MAQKSQKETPQEPNDRYKWLVLLIVIMGSFMAILDNSIVNVALPHLMVAFSSNLEEIEWVVTGYMLAFAILMPLTVWLRDALGLKNAFILALLFFIMGSALCGISWNRESLIFFRIIQAIGGGALMPTGLTMTTEVFPPEERGMALGIWGAGATIAPAVGPTLGGYLVDYVNWRYIFYINIPIGIVVIATALIILRKDRGHGGSVRFDLPGFFFLSMALAGLLLGFTQGEREGWHSPYILAMFGTAYFSFLIFLITERLVKNPIVELSIFNNRNFSLGCIMGVIRSIGLFSSVFLMPLFLQNLMGYTAFDTGLLMMPSALAVSVSMPLAGNITDRIGPKVPAVFGGILTAYSLYLYSRLSLNSSYEFLLYGFIIRGVGLGFLMAPLTVATINAAPKRMMSLASGLLNVIMQVSGAFGVAIFSSMLSRREAFHSAEYYVHLTPDNVPLSILLSKISQNLNGFKSSIAGTSEIAQALLFRYLKSWAAVNSFDDVFLVSAFVVGIGSMLVLFLKDIYPQKGIFGHFKSDGKLGREHYHHD